MPLFFKNLLPNHYYYFDMKKFIFLIFIIPISFLNLAKASNVPFLEDDIFVFSSFSPNGDGKDDFFSLQKLEDFPNNAVKVFNREGLLVFEKEYYRNDWNGYFQGVLLPEGVYFYILDDGKGKIFSGAVQLLKR